MECAAAASETSSSGSEPQSMEEEDIAPAGERRRRGEWQMRSGVRLGLRPVSYLRGRRRHAEAVSGESAKTRGDGHPPVVGPPCQRVRGGRVRAPPKPPQIWAWFGVCRTARSFRMALGAAVGWEFLAQNVSGLSARAFGQPMGEPVGDALITGSYGCRHGSLYAYRHRRPRPPSPCSLVHRLPMQLPWRRIGRAHV